MLEQVPHSLALIRDEERLLTAHFSLLTDCLLRFGSAE